MRLEAPRRRVLIVVLLGAVLLEALLTVWSVLHGLFRGRPELHFEEAYSAEVASYLLSGHWAELLEVQYRSFCGGCSVEALLAAPLYLALGRSLGVWKLVPLAFHLATMVLAILLARRLWGRVAAVIVAAMFLAAPPSYRLVAEVGWGNHAESAVFSLGALLVLRRAISGGGRARKWSWRWSGLAGLVAGFGFFFCYTSGHAFPAMVLLLVVGSRLRGLSRSGLLTFPLGFGVGFSPWVLHRLVMELPLRFEQTSVVGAQAFPQGPGPVAALRFFLHDSFVLGVWRGYGKPLPVVVAYGWWAVALAVLLVATWLGFRRLRLGRGRSDEWSWDLLGPLLALGLFMGMALEPSTFKSLPDDGALHFFHMRYFTPLFVATTLAAGTVLGRLWSGWWGSRCLVCAVLVGLLGPGLYARVVGLGPVSFQAAGVVVPQSLQREDPPIRDREPAELARYLAGHRDRYPEVRDMHFARVGRSLVQRKLEGFDGLWGATQLERERSALCEGVVHQLAPQWEIPSAPPERLLSFIAAAPPESREELARAMGRWGVRNHGRGTPPGSGWYQVWSVLETLEGPVLGGACEVAGFRTGEYLLHPATDEHRRGELLRGLPELMARCPMPQQVLYAMGRAHTQHGGCQRGRLAAGLPEELDHPSFWEGVAWACENERTF